ncbi:pyridoxal phosphate-dependent aminotransferase [Haloarcula salinisoli]|uniref:Pyridoxal phosphate-dependent aminotransferase n=1 Tax=Haloarcula salinisoli TaxID=2487746 RepID=A0A8J7YGH4_9EURY|nr:pyridoxal phosphate-dependent aminotransferase [Halomicroarcula salinisoli]MBX0285902.1 pyridoxal phosphate-dependent aminotransferase [Halomicroarcula salinisoli]MBX0302604.1 pyridoxal phosphate-dependent aminotransferase [Halomicroarcula salinisoli]
MDYETPQFYRVMQYAARADRDVVDMVSGSPDWDPPAGVRAGLREYADGDPADFQYAPSRGLRGLRERIANRHGVDADRIVVTNGAGEANHLAMTGGLDQFDGEEILLADPVYPYYAGRANFLDAETTFVPVADDGRLDPDAVRGAASSETAVVVVNSPNNPTGAVYDADAMAAFATVAEDNDALLVSDEVYDQFDYSGRFASALDIGSPNVVATNAFSKSMAITGFRVGYAVFPPTDGPTGELVDRATTRHMLTNVSGSRPAQYAVERAMETTDSAYYEAARDRLRARIETFCGALDATGATYTRPDGGFYVLARFPEFPGTFENAEVLVDDAGVAGMPGAAFGDARADWLRFSLTTPRVETAAERLVEYFR